MKPAKDAILAGHAGPFRESARPALLPLAGGRTVALMPTTNWAMTALSGGLLFAIVPVGALLWFFGLSAVAAASTVVLGVITAVVVIAMNLRQHMVRWVVHFDDANAVLEDRRAGTAIRLTRKNVRLGVHRFSPSSGISPQSTFVIDPDGASFVVGASRDLQVAFHTTKQVESTGAPDVLARQHSVWDALRAAAARPPE